MSEKKTLLLACALLALGSASLIGCTKATTDSGVPALPRVPEVTGPALEDSAKLPPTVELSNGAEIALQPLAGSVYFLVEGTFSENSFARIRAHSKSAEIRNILKRLRAIGAIPSGEEAEIGYFTFLLPYRSDLMASLKGMRFDHDLVFSPVATDRRSLEQIRSLTPRAEGLVARAGAPRGSLAGFSGLDRIHAPEFVRLAEGEIGGGARVNGDSVNLGITDTGITLNHPSFLSTDRSRNRVVYLRDFTREGRVYFSPKARFEARASANDESKVVLDAQIIVTPKLPMLPAADGFSDVQGVEISVSPELKALLLAPGTRARLGALLEESFQSEGEPLDINNNGKSDDQLLVLHVPGDSSADDVIYVDFSGTGDFSRVKALGDWNRTGQSVEVFAEKIGFDLRDDKLPSADGKGELEVKSASVVGYDPGNHGSHVAGIAAGSRTLMNDRSDDPAARGVAPDARILMNRVCANNAGCNATQAMIDLALRGGAHVINMSLGGLSPFNDGYGVQETVVNRLTSLKNVLMVISAGNSGPGRQTVGSPSTARLSLSVGAAVSVGMLQRQYQWPGEGLIESPEADRDLMFFFSSRGPTAAGGFKPSLSAPGTQLSAVRLNSAPGSRGGLDVYWGTSMAAPAASGAYALLLDAIHKYNERNPKDPLTTDAATLRRILLESARPFDVTTLDSATGEARKGRYTWIDQGTGMIDLVAAWRKVREHREASVESAVTLNGAPVELEYKVLVPMKNPLGQAYDGTRPSETEPVFGAGLYLDYAATETLLPVYVSRALPEALAAGPDAGNLTRQLLTTADEFVLRTVIHGSDKKWLKAGALDSLNGQPGCAGSDAANPLVMGRGVEVHAAEDGTATLDPFLPSALNVCIDREMIRRDLEPGDHGALIHAYRVVNGRAESVPSFIVPVYLQVPHRVLSGSLAYETEGSIKAFGVSRNYVTIPEGTSLLQVTLEVPALKPGAGCAGVELMALEGNNQDSPFASRREARAMNCDAKGVALPAARQVVRFTRTNPRAGTWDLHLFGLYRYAESRYKLRVDYLTAASSVGKISGGRQALKGSLEWKVAESSLGVSPDAAKSVFAIDSLTASVSAQVAKGASVIVESPASGALRSYPEGTRSVTVTTGGSPGNDIDLLVLACDAGATNAPSFDESSCVRAAQSGGSTDEESATFKPEAGKVYAVRVDGFDIKDEGRFISTETITQESEQGSITIAGSSPAFEVLYSFSESQLSGSRLLGSALFRSGKYEVLGALTLKAADGAALFSVPVRIHSD